MIDPKELLNDLKRLLRELEGDLRERLDEVPEFREKLLREYESAVAAERTAESFTEWTTDKLTQAAVAWILSCVFVRFMEDNRLIDPPRLSGPSERLARARDEHELYYRQHPERTDREYLLHVFREIGSIPAAHDLFDERHNLVHHLELSGDGAAQLLQFWQRIDPESGELRHNFQDEDSRLIAQVAERFQGI